MRQAVAALVRKDLTAERRTLESVPAMTLFAVTTFVLFHFGLDRSELDGDLAAGVLWVTLLFAAVLGQNRLFVAEDEQGGFDGFLLAPVDRTALFVAKALALFAFLVVVELVAVPAFAVLLLGPGLLDPLPGLLAILALANAGIAVVATLAAALAIRTRARDLIGPLLTLPLLVPVVLAASEATAPLLAQAGAEGPPGRWLAILAIYDLTIGLVAYGVFDFLLED
ncbi:MAG TPA: heme exporter protein CcmB [Solirubrobacteraceae bacterium]|nr:heme exporter protein CcmB [Solirubrobacteraceae bacterium]